LKAGPTIDVCKTQDEAKQIIEIREHEDLILETARRLVKQAVNKLMETHHKTGRKLWDRSPSTLPLVERQRGEKVLF
jgi:20S proteasome alpha/beta subunit